MVNIVEISNSELTEKIAYHDKIGGALKISVYKVLNNYLGEMPTEYLAHMVAARQALEKQNWNWNFHCNKISGQGNRKDIKTATTNYELLDSSGIKISWQEFLGPHFDIVNHKPFIRGQQKNDTLNSYFYYDLEEILSNRIDMEKVINDYNNIYPESRGYFINALTDPPYSLRLPKEIFKLGDYVFNFMDYFFGDVRNSIIYAWDTNCSIVFDPGKEWWGSYFWTIYNPEKNWYIGILASETD